MSQSHESTTADESASRSPPAERSVTDDMTSTGGVARVAELEAENERLREAVSAARRRQYRFTAISFAVVGLLALGGAVLFPGQRTVLIALGGTGIFGAVLTYFLTPERFVAATVGERIYGTLAGNEATIVDDLALEGTPTVVPIDGSAAPARLFVSVAPDTSPPERDALGAPFVTGETPGLAIAPTGVGLYQELSAAATMLPDAPSALARTVGDALVEQFELIDGVEVDAEPGRITMAVEGSAYGPLDRFDHPVASLLATTLAVEMGQSVSVTVSEAERGDWLVTCRFDTPRGE